MSSVTLITTGQPTTNPRLVKEVDALIANGYQVKVICCFYQSWALNFDEEITGKYPDTFIFCGGDPVKEIALYYKSRLRQKISTLLWKYFKTPRIAANTISRTHTEAVAIAKKIKTDIYIAHNLGALPAAVMAAKFSGAKVGYDAEDMHSAQYNSTDDSMYLLNKYIETKYFPQVDYFTAASPLIAGNYKLVYTFLNPVVINNVFPKTDFKISATYHVGEPLKLFWFSQTIGPGRGLEWIVKAMGNVNKSVQLHLLGAVSMRDKQDLIDLAIETGLQYNQLQFHEPVSPDRLFELATQFHIGIASEDAFTLNRDICLTNKIFTYLQSGLAIIASDTQAQSAFLREYSAAGRLFSKGNETSLAAQLNFYAENPEALYQTQLSNYQLGQTELNWEMESEKFLSLVKSTLVE